MYSVYGLLLLLLQQVVRGRGDISFHPSATSAAAATGILPGTGQSLIGQSIQWIWTMR